MPLLRTYDALRRTHPEVRCQQHQARGLRRHSTDLQDGRRTIFTRVAQDGVAARRDRDLIRRHRGGTRDCRANPCCALEEADTVVVRDAQDGVCSQHAQIKGVIRPVVEGACATAGGQEACLGVVVRDRRARRCAVRRHHAAAVVHADVRT